MSLNSTLVFPKLILKVENSPRHKVYEFGDYRVDVAHRMLYLEGAEIPMAPKAVETLLALIERRGKIVSKEELLEAVWPDTVVEESNLFVYLSLLRKTLGTLEDGQPYVETLRRRGYRFNGSVRLVEEGEDGKLALTARESDNKLGAQAHGIYIVKDWGNRAAEPLKTPPGSSALPALAVIESLDIATPATNDFDNSESAKITKSERNESETAGSPNQVPRIKYSRARYIAATVILISVLAAGLFYWRHRQGRSANSDHPRTIAILPFRPLSGVGLGEVWELGMTDRLITGLSNLHLAVQSLSAVRHFNGPEQDPIAAGKVLKVELVLEPSYQKLDDNHIHINLRVLNVADGTAAWTDSSVEKSTDPFILQETIAMKVVSGLSLTLTSDESMRLTKRYTNNVEANSYYTLARLKELTLTDEGLNQAISYFDKAIEADPNYALAYAHEADAYRARAGAGFAREKDVLPQQEKLARRAMELDGSLPEAYLQLAWLDSSNGELASAERKYRQVIALNPMEFQAHLGLAATLSRLKKPEEALAEVRRAREVAPTTPMALMILSDMLLQRGYTDEVITQAKRTFEIDPNFWVAHLWLGRAYAKQKRYTEAISELETAKELVPTSHNPLLILAQTFIEMGNRERALEVIDELNLRFTNNPISFVHLAGLYNSLGETNKALDSLEKALEDHDRLLRFIDSEKRWDNLRSEPRFAEILRRISVEK